MEQIKQQACKLVIADEADVDFARWGKKASLMQMKQ